MSNDQAKLLLQQLRDGELESVRIEKNDFLIFRQVLAEQEDMKSFRGNAQRGGGVIYTYEPGWTK
ncbi:hypothetical protein P4637_09520 [Halalkalibacterium halodurans]|jgi:hypothetical protein|uniref:BH2327 protein n=2 Tax=Halalkalibacterium halodurans TaxID=86665 RepID=Q9KAG0_HALH5|nr:hypothetical protein [Halalkalibacterium halodurans]MDY7222878.1 hypothetical protein [Halalkalibacterium halodurans]MDY7242099.1 hypothetical protein [Halalkalibacterium halodurans]MED3648110.1 hypothetical protein [Halalkalibacterium halodurans]MED4080890.1 hypothetical protein [Halalkalibacterium halodurans]MED4085073.1 hypothetical protein [Halalkalibacterium halodurans]